MPAAHAPFRQRRPRSKAPVRITLISASKHAGGLWGGGVGARSSRAALALAGQDRRRAKALASGARSSAGLGRGGVFRVRAGGGVGRGVF